MKVKALGYRTDLIFPSFDGELLDREGYLVVRTPANRGFYWGNFLLFPGPPERGDDERWPELFRKEIGAPPDVRHQAFGWDSTELEKGEYQPFLERGFRLLHSHVLATSELHPPRWRSQDVIVRPLDSRADWEMAVENQVRCRDPKFSAQDYRQFRRTQMARYQAMAAQHLGAWYGAFLGDELVADLGVFSQGRLGRYQSVQTHPDFRRQGIGGTLVYTAGRHSQARFGINGLVIVAQAESAGERLYQSIGFEFREHQLGLERFPTQE